MNLHNIGFICILVFNIVLLYRFLMYRKDFKDLKQDLTNKIHSNRQESMNDINMLRKEVILKVEESELKSNDRLETSINIISKRLDKRVKESKN